jgi:hypothetical protein
MPGQSARLNGRKGGRPKGGKNDDKAALVRKRIADAAEALVEAQLAIALGCVVLYRRDGVVTVRVTDQEEVFRYLSGTVGPDGYHLVSTRDPDIRAIEAAMNRAFGRPVESVSLTGQDGGPVTVKHINTP